MFIWAFPYHLTEYPLLISLRKVQNKPMKAQADDRHSPQCHQILSHSRGFRDLRSCLWIFPSGPVLYATPAAIMPPDKAVLKTDSPEYRTPSFRFPL